MMKSVSSCGSVTALSTVIRFQSHPINTEASHVACCDLICVGMCSRVLVCDLVLNKVVAVCDEGMPLGLRVHGIAWQQCGPSEALLVIHGGRCVAVLKLSGRKGECSGEWRWDIVKVAETFVGKWILDVSVCPIRDQCQIAVENNPVSSSVHVISVGMIDNAVSVFQWESGKKALQSVIPIVRVPGDWMRCILYSMSIHSEFVYNDNGKGGRYVCKVAAGTILWDVAVWSFECEMGPSYNSSSIRMESLYSILSQNVFSSAHKGSIHSVMWSRDGLWLASGSDDRVVKVWNMSTMSLHVELLGHSSRIWSLLLFRTHDEGGTLIVLSGAEDGSVWCWEVEQHTMQSEGVVSRRSWFKPHEFRGVWQIGLYGEDVLITGGADGSIKLWSLFDAVGVTHGGGGQHAMASYSIPDLFEYMKNDDKVESMNRNMIALLETSMSAQGEMNILADAVQSMLNVNDLKKKKAMSSGRFEGIKDLRFVLHGSFVILSTDVGRLLGMSVPAFQGTKECSIVWGDERVDVLYTQSGASERPITALRTLDMSHKTYVSCCNVDGQVCILELLSHNGTLMVGRVLCLDVHSHLEGRPVDAFLLPGFDTEIFVIVTSTAGSLVLFAVHCKVDDGMPMVSHCLGVAQCPNCSRVTAVAQYNFDTLRKDRSGKMDMLLALGSAKGGLSMWMVGPQCGLTCIGAQKTAHGTTAVQSISISIIKDCSYLIQTGGSNACIQNYILRDPGTHDVRLERKNEVRFDSIKTICSTFGTTPVRNGKLIAGFFTTDFIIWDTEMNSMICSIQAAGWKRPWEFHLDALHGRIMFCYSAGLSDIHLYQQKYSLDAPKVNLNLPRSLLLGGHGREINSIVNAGGGLFVTAGEDATLRAFIETSSVLSSYLVNTQPIGTSARILRCTDFGNHRLIVSGGAKAVMTAWTVSIDDSKCDPRSMLLHYSTFQSSKYVKGKQVDTVLYGDLRIITLSLIQSNCSGATAFVVLSMSNGEIELRYIPSTNPKNFLIHDWPLLAMLQSCNCPPVLSLDNDGAWVYGGNTNGDLMVWNVAESLNFVLSSASPVTTSIEPVWMSSSFHKCGINGLGVILCSSITKRIIVSGGDDQAIGLIYLDIDTGNTLWSATFENAHASSVRDLSVCGDHHICSIGLDQYLRVWKISEPKDSESKICSIREVTSTLLQVLEPVSISVSSSTTVPNMYSMAVAGRGIETFSICIDET